MRILPSFLVLAGTRLAASFSGSVPIGVLSAGARTMGLQAEGTASGEGHSVSSQASQQLSRDRAMQPRLEELLEELQVKGRRKVKKARQHVNPLSQAHLKPVELPDDWFRSAFANPLLPLCVDIGCAYGRFCMDMAALNPSMNYLGIEIRRPVTAVCLARAADKGLNNCYFVSANANIDFERMMRDVERAGCSLTQVTIQFPDPHFKNRNRKRRVLQPPLIKSIEASLAPGGTLFMQGDIFEVQKEMRLLTREHAPGLQDARGDVNDWMHDEPVLEIQTEREVATLAKGEPVYRCLFTKSKAK
jgi:tRNA (guanine-N7-)-methyltransferase